MNKILCYCAITAALAFCGCSKSSDSTTAASSGTPAPRDPAAFQTRAEQGDVTAQVQLAKALAGRMDFAGAAHWFGVAMTNGSLEATACLGELYQAGRGEPPDMKKAVALFTEAAEKGNVTAQYDLAFLYEQGIGVTQSRTNSARWYKLASEGGDPTAQYDLGQRYFLGVGVPKDPVEGMKWLLIAEHEGQPDAAGKIAALLQGMTAEQMAQGRREAADFKPRPPKT